MDISRGLILKGTAATTAVATTSTGAYYHEEIIDYFTDDSSDVEEGEGSSVPGAGGEQSSGGVVGPGDSVLPPAVKKEKTEKDSLGLPDNWAWPNDSEKTKNKDLSVGELKKVNFYGKGNDDLNISNGTSSPISLTIEKVDNTNEFPKGLKFVFKPKNDKDVTINGGTVSIALKKGMDLEFKIKETGDKWSLERAWDKTTLTEKVNLTCSGDSSGSNGCSFRATETINILEDANSKSIGATISLGSGKIKLEEDQAEYNQGFKFTVEGGDIGVTGGNNSQITKLKKYSTYEIREQDHEGGKKWFLVRKTSAKQEINKKLLDLGLPKDCKFDDGKNDAPKVCDDLDGNTLGKIKFEGLGSSFTASISGSEKVGLKISKTSNEGVRIVFENKKKVTFSGGGSSSPIVWKKGTNPEFKINSSGKLERAWTVDKLGEEVGLKCTAIASGTNKGECTFETNKSIRVYEEESKKATNAKVNDTSRKLEFFLNEENHNQGFKFTVKGSGDINLSSGSAVASLIKDNSSYEIKYQTDGWYLSKKTTISP